MTIRNISMRSILIFFSLLLRFKAFNQAANAADQIAVLRNVVPPSPNASSLGKYGDLPVSLYTGIPSISVPVYELKGRSLSVPVSLSYHASGNKVGEIPSWVGLGWSLNAGGVITRSVRGLPDEQGYFTSAAVFTDPNNLSSIPLNSANWNILVVGSAKNTADSQEDMYSFNALGRSYKFILKADGTVLTVPFSNLKVTANPIVGPGTSMNGWTVLMEDGTKLDFGGGTSFNEITDNPRFNGGDGNGLTFTSSWYLKSITSPTNEVILFSYSIGSSPINQDSYYSESDYIEFRNSIHADPNFCALVNESSTTTASVEKQTISALNLASIESELGRVEFILNSSERLDLPGGRALQEIKVFSKLDNKYIEDFLLNSSYSQSVSGNEITNGLINISYYHNRLRLNSVEKKDVTDINAPTQKWTFDYNSQNLPSRHSYAQDHWGFFNGATNNTTLLPPEYFVIPAGVVQVVGTNPKVYGFMGPNHKIGGNREGDGNYMQAEILTAIHFPTGGYSSFSYEPNTIPVTEETFSNGTLDLNLYVEGLGPYINQTSGTFTITKPQYVNIISSVFISPSVIAQQPSTTGTVKILDQSGNIVVSVTGNANKWFNLLSAGTYTFQATTNVGQSSLNNPQDNVRVLASLKFSLSNGPQSFNKCVGGLRIKNIMDYDGLTSNGVNKRYFVYESPLIINPVDLTNDYITVQTKKTYDQSNSEQCTWVTTTRNSSSRFALGSIQGGTIGYGKVTTLYGQNGENGKTVSLFTSEPDNGTSLSKLFPYPPTDSKDHRRGLLLSEIHYNAGQTILSQTDNTYVFNFVSSVTGFKAGYEINMDPFFCTNTYQNCGIKQGFFTMTHEQVRHSITAQYKYDNNGLNPLTNVINYFYDNPNNTQATRIETINSKGNIIKTLSWTPLEKAEINNSFTLSATASLAIDSMIVRNIISPVLQKDLYNGTQLKQRSRVNFRLWTNNFLLPDNIQLKTGANPIETKIQFNNYDVKGNLKEQQKADDVKQTYIYSYSNNYPVAEVVNADSASIAYTSFEADGNGNWTNIIAGNIQSDLNAITGGKIYALTSAPLTKSGLLTSQSYIVSYWSKNGSCAVTGSTGQVITGRSVNLNGNNWTYYQHTVTGVTSSTVSGNAIIDELRLYPKGALMTTYTHEPMIGMKTQCDVNNRTMYYEYDSFNRVKLIRDQDGNVLKTYEYKYLETQQ